MKVKMEKSQQDYGRSREKLEELTIQLNSSDISITKLEMEYSAKIKRLEEKPADTGSQKLEADKTYKDQISNLHSEFTNYKTKSAIYRLPWATLTPAAPQRSISWSAPPAVLINKFI
jgi:hypothetical protein